MRYLALLLALAACAAVRHDGALTREQAAVLEATLDGATPRILQHSSTGATRRHTAQELKRLRHALRNGDARTLKQAVRRVRVFVKQHDSDLEALLQEADAAVAQRQLLRAN